MNKQEMIEKIHKDWDENPRWDGITRNYTADEVVKLMPSIPVDHSLANAGSNRFTKLLKEEAYVNSLGALTGSQAVQMVKAGLQAIYMSGWQVAADANQSGQTYPDQSLYPSNSVPQLVKRLNNALMRADLLNRVEGKEDIYWYAPIVADAEAGFGGPLHAFELMKGMIEAGAAAVHFEDQLASEKKCGHLGGKVLVPTSQFIRTLTGARLAADVCNVPSYIIARTDSLAATLMTSDIDPVDAPFLTGERTPEGYFKVKPGLDSAIARGLSYAPYADLIWFETSVPDIGEAKEFAAAIKEKYPNKMLAYNCSPSFNWEAKLDKTSIAKFQTDLAEFGYKFQFITLAGWHSINYHMFDLAKAYKTTGMTAFVDLQSREFKRESDGYTAVKHQREVGTGYFDNVLMTITGGEASTAALAGSTEEEQFNK
ncbi:isocitrate lyase [Pseudobacteriovorax antillogorgiicola]|uniref:Isocitrate lyase n=1 Tax=Pseudobacteriovorax antillogorgiicola TaxID=1513793 RepID=A0A1Y6BZ14_9BACT|nr:isocitrate lyase [Pseudobacteriovorax antillogorgiicola]TCS50233.1 isocitrate lyase [Pseudobacteriovorax antillogorgiicola]SMF32717.1 isocitrate lyase [Pseudobacteriovorax antillogorgiicola]